MFPLLIFLMSLKDLGNPIVNTYDQEVEVEASISGLPNESYFRVEWQRSAGDTYFGDIKVNDNWVEVNSSQDCKNYLHILDTNTSSLSFLTKVGNVKNLVNGGYNLKLRRYTASCASYSDSDPIQITLNLQTPNATPSPTTTPNPTPTKTTTPNPTKSPPTSPPAVPTSRPIASVRKIEDTLDLNDISQVLDPQNVLGLENSPSSSPFGVIPTSSPNSKNKAPIIAFVLVALGIIFVSTSTYMILQTSKTKNTPK